MGLDDAVDWTKSTGQNSVFFSVFLNILTDKSDFQNRILKTMGLQPVGEDSRSRCKFKTN